METFRHLSVLPEEVIQFLNPHPGGVYLDGTLGGGGHAGLILERCTPGGMLIGHGSGPGSTAGRRTATG